MNIVSWNVNGLRSVYKKGALLECIQHYEPDIICLQETKATAQQVKNIDEDFSLYTTFYTSAQKAGYSGTAIWVHKKFQDPIFSSGIEPFYSDTEGRVSRVDIAEYAILSVYFPNGGKSEEAWKEKLIFYTQFLAYIKKVEQEGKVVIFCGDINCCHQPIDIARPKENEGKVGFHPLERNCISDWVKSGWKDVWREKNLEVAHQYSWWTYRGGARERNVGWRIDSFFVPEKLLSSVSLIKYQNAQMGSDHCPVQMILD